MQSGLGTITKWILSGVTAISVGLGTAVAQKPDLLIADFEGTNYGDWIVTGTAFGSGPAHGTLPNQMKVDGFRGRGLVNSFYGGDDSTGTLTSPPFKFERKFVQFLMGGGGWPDRTCMNLLVEGKVVRTATGPNTRAGGTERLEPQRWDVHEFLGQTGVIQIVDNATGGWGHINVDHIVQTDRKAPEIVTLKEISRQIKAEKRYLNFPVSTGAPKRHLKVLVDDHVEREFEIELVADNVEWRAFLDITALKGKQLTIQAEKMPEDSTALNSIDQTDEIKDHETLYRESLRPQFHFTSRRGWLNDPNGLVFYKGEYHLFYQHNPYGWNWGNMHWGHAVSTDLVHWKELPIALYPDRLGTMFSGSAVVDWKNTAGFQRGSEKALVAIFTDAGEPFTQGLAFSNDKGRTWSKYDKNPVLPHIVKENRDPKVIWYTPENKWIMALYLDGNHYALFASPALKHWEKLCDVMLPGDAECPEFFEMPIEGQPHEKRWIFYGASGKYLVGKFDGKNFKSESEPLSLQDGNAWYASQTFNDIPTVDGRRILIPWGRMADEKPPFKGMAFNQMMGIPVELTLRDVPAGLRLYATPVRELSTLRRKTHHIENRELRLEENPIRGIKGELLDITADITAHDASAIVFNVHGQIVTYDVLKQELYCAGKKASLPLKAGRVRLRMLVDRLSIDIFGNDGELYMPIGVVLDPGNTSVQVASRGGSALVNSLDVSELKSAWK
jgi:fructan beta-fructosidase